MEDDISLSIVEAKESGNSVVLKLQIEAPLMRYHTTDERIVSQQPVSQAWEIEAEDHLDHTIHLGEVPFIRLESDHPLLWLYTDQQSELYYKGTIHNYADLFHDFFQIHQKLFGTYHPFQIELGQGLQKNGRHYTSGLAAKGPEQLLKLYAESLSRRGLEYSMLKSGKPTSWNRTEEAPFARPQVLLFDTGHVIAKNFLFSQLT